MIKIFNFVSIFDYTPIVGKKQGESWNRKKAGKLEESQLSGYLKS